MKRISNILYWRKPKEREAIKFVAVVFALALAVLALPITTQAGSISHVRGNSANAFFQSFDSSGCIETDVFVVPTDDNRVQNPPGPGNSSSSVSMFISQFNLCTGTQPLAADCSASLAEQDFQVSRKLDSATLNATLECFESVSSSSFNVSANLTWIATGAPTIERSSSHFFFPGCKMNSRFDGTFTSAQASGTVSDGTTNFTPNTSNFADIASVKSGEVDIGCQIPTPSP